MAVARVLKKGGFDQIFSVSALLDPSQIQLGGLGERCKLPQRGLGRPRRNEFDAFQTKKEAFGNTTF